MLQKGFHSLKIINLLARVASGTKGMPVSQYKTDFINSSQTPASTLAQTACLFANIRKPGHFLIISA